MTEGTAIPAASPRTLWDDVCVRVRPVLMRTAVAILEDLGDAEDAVQDALLAGWLAAGSLADPERLTAWLVAIVRNRSLSMLRTRARRRRIGTRMWEHGREVPEPPDASSALPDCVEFREELAALPRSQREAVSDVLAGSVSPMPARMRTALSRAAARLGRQYA